MYKKVTTDKDEVGTFGGRGGLEVIDLSFNDFDSDSCFGGSCLGGVKCELGEGPDQNRLQLSIAFLVFIILLESTSLNPCYAM